MFYEIGDKISDVAYLRMFLFSYVNYSSYERVIYERFDKRKYYKADF